MARLNTDEVFENIMGFGSDDQKKVKKENKEISPSQSPEQSKLIQTSFYITEKHRKALKIRTALSEIPEDKDQSSIVRAALDAYLANTLKSF